MSFLLTAENVDQAPLTHRRSQELVVAISSLALGGAENIVLDWAMRVSATWKVHLIVLRDREEEWPVPPGIKITRFHGVDTLSKLRAIGKVIAESSNPVCVCHLLNKKERDALMDQGVEIVPVLHNASAGWPEDVSCLEGARQVIAVSSACANELRAKGWKGHITTIRHIPRERTLPAENRQRFRAAWRIPESAAVIGMIGAVKNQKNYVRAIQILSILLKKRDAYLVIVGGPVANKGREPWMATIAEIERLGVRHRVAMPGFVPDAIRCLPAFDAMLNTSHYEGLSIATLEVLQQGLPVVASKVGGQGEIASEGLTLLSLDDSDESWANALDASLNRQHATPSWSRFPSHRLWTLASLARDVRPTEKTLFVTANLNSGGAQRSLVNLTKSLAGTLPFQIFTLSKSTSTYFYRDLTTQGIGVYRTNEIWNPFNHAEAIVDEVASQNIGTVCFWNVDARVKLLVVKALAFTKVRFIDVSPGDYSFEEMTQIREFENLICYSQDDYYRRLNELVLKFDGPRPVLCRQKTTVIRNGVEYPRKTKTDYRIKTVPQVVVSGRIAPTKFTLEILAAMKIVRQALPTAEVHFFGGAENFHEGYAAEVMKDSKNDLNTSVFFHGTNFEAVNRLAEFDAYVVLGKNQGCPNALLEALAVGLPSVGNDDGGTREQIIDGKTGLLIAGTDPVELADAILRLLTDRNMARQIGQTGRAHVLGTFSMRQMTRHYLRLFMKPTIQSEPKAHNYSQFTTSAAQLTKTEDKGA